MALKDIFVLNSSYDADMLFFDEIAENLDEKGINGLYNLLQEIKVTRSNLFEETILRIVSIKDDYFIINIKTR